MRRLSSINVLLLSCRLSRSFRASSLAFCCSTSPSNNDALNNEHRSRLEQLFLSPSSILVQKLFAQSSGGSQPLANVSSLLNELADTDEYSWVGDLLESDGFAAIGGLRGFVQSHGAISKLFHVHQDVASKRWFVVKQRSNDSGSVAVPPKPAVKEEEVTPDHSPCKKFWLEFDPGFLLPFIPRRQFVAWNDILTILPKDLANYIPKEKRSKNVCQKLAPYCDVCLTPRLMFRVKREAEHPNIDDEGAVALLNGVLFDDATILEVVRHLPASGLPFHALDACIPTSLAELLKKDSDKSLAQIFSKELVRQYGTILMCLKEERPPMGNVPVYYPLLRDEDLVKAPLAAHSTVVDLEATARGIQTCVMRYWEAHKGFPTAFALDKVMSIVAASSEGKSLLAMMSECGGLRRVLLACPEVLPLDDEGLLDLAMCDSKPVVPSKDSALIAIARESGLAEETIASLRNDEWVRTPPSRSCIGALAPRPIANDDELKHFQKIVLTRWNNTKPSRKLLSAIKKAPKWRGSPFQDQKRLAQHIRAQCPSDRFVTFSELGTLIGIEARVWLPDGSLLKLLRNHRSEFEVVESFQGSSTEYSVRARATGEVGGSEPAIHSKFTDEEIVTFIDHCIPQRVHGTGLLNLWAKLPSSVREQLRGVRGLTTLLHKYSDMFELQKDIVRPIHEGSPEGSCQQGGDNEAASRDK